MDRQLPSSNQRLREWPLIKWISSDSKLPNTANTYCEAIDRKKLAIKNSSSSSWFENATTRRCVGLYSRLGLRELEIPICLCSTQSEPFTIGEALITKTALHGVRHVGYVMPARVARSQPNERLHWYEKCLEIYPRRSRKAVVAISGPSHHGILPWPFPGRTSLEASCSLPYKQQF